MVDEYQDTNYAQYLIAKYLASGQPEHLRRRRRRPVDLLLARRRHPQHPELREGLHRRRASSPWRELPLHASPILTAASARDPEQRQPEGQRPHAPSRATASRWSGAGPTTSTARRSSWSNTHHLAEAPGEAHEQRLRRLLPDQRPVPRVRGRAPEGEHPLPGRGRHEVLRPQGDQGHHGLPEIHRQSPRPGLPACASSTPRRAASATATIDKITRYAAHGAACRNGR